MKLKVTPIRRVEVELGEGERPVIQVSGHDFTVTSATLHVIEDGTERVDGMITAHGFLEWTRLHRNGDKELTTPIDPEAVPAPLVAVIANMLAAR